MNGYYVIKKGWTYMSMLKSAPVPYFTVDRNFKILNRSKLAMTTFAPVDNFLDVVDTFSKEKAKKYLRTEYIVKDDWVKKLCDCTAFFVL